MKGKTASKCQSTWYRGHETQFAIENGISVLLALIAMAGNGFVIYVATRKKNRGTLRYLNRTVKSLAITDFLFGLLGIPLSIVYYYWSKCFIV